MSAGEMIDLSIITVCRNDLQNVKSTVGSLTKQSCRSRWEHVLVDGASSDGTEEWYRSLELPFRCTVLSELDSGIYDAMNKSLDIARGEYVLFLNAGDKFADAHVVDRLLSRIEERPTWGYSRARQVDADGREVRRLVGRVPYSKLFHLYGIANICHQTVLMRRSFLEELGGFDPGMGHAADYHLLLKAAHEEKPRTWSDIDVDYLVGGVSDVQVYDGLWLGHVARTSVLRLNALKAFLDLAWTCLQVGNIKLRKTVKPVVVWLGSLRTRRAPGCLRRRVSIRKRTERGKSA